MPFSGYPYSVDWRFLKGLERHRSPVSYYLAPKFVAEARDIALGEVRAEALFDEIEVAIALGYVHKLLAEGRPHSGMPSGRFCWKSGGETLEVELKRIEGLPDSGAFFKGGMLGGSKATAAPTLQKVREISPRYQQTWLVLRLRASSSGQVGGARAAVGRGAAPRQALGFGPVGRVLVPQRLVSMARRIPQKWRRKIPQFGGRGSAVGLNGASIVARPSATF